MVSIVNSSKLVVAGLGFVCGVIGWCLLVSLSPVFVDDACDYPELPVHVGHHEGETVLVNEWKKAVPLLAFILISQNKQNNATALIKSTWAQRFNKYVFYRDTKDRDLPGFELQQLKGWARTRLAILHVHDHYLSDFKFFMKTDDTNYVIVENLQALLQKMDPQEPLLIGRQMTATVTNISYMSDASGYVMSQAALRNIVAGIRGKVGACRENHDASDLNLGKCATAMGVKFVHALDEEGLDVFHSNSPSEVLDGLVRTLNPGQRELGPDAMIAALTNCSDRSITFSNTLLAEYYMLEYMVYHLYPYGIIRNVENYNQLQLLLRTT